MLQMGTAMTLMVACIARASRAYAIGLEHGDGQMRLANFIVANERFKADVLLNQIFDPGKAVC